MEHREYIERFALGQLSGSDLHAFEARLAADPDFAEEVRQEVELVRALRLAPELAAFRQQLETLEQQDSPKPDTRRFLPPRLLWALAAAVVLILAAIWWLSSPAKPTAQALLAIYYQPPQEMYIPRRTRGEADSSTLNTHSPFLSLLDEAEAAYNKGQPLALLQCLSRLEAMPESADYADELSYYTGLACLQSQQPERAIAAFEKISNEYPTEKPWYLALARLHAGQTAAARADLETIARSASPFAPDAKALLEQL